MTYGVTDLATHIRLCAVLSHRRELSVVEAWEMQPWELDAYVDMIVDLREQDNKENKNGQ